MRPALLGFDGVHLHGFGAVALPSRPMRVHIGLGDIADAVSMEWARDAACIGEDPALFFPEVGDRVEPALQICRGCAVRDPCLAYAMASNIVDGIWGGVTANGRRARRQAS